MRNNLKNLTKEELIDRYIKQDKIIAELNTELAKHKNDISDSKSMLLANNTIYKEILERTNEGIIIIKDDKVKYCNQYFYSLLGFSKQEILGMPIKNLLRSDEFDLLFSSKHVENNRDNNIPFPYQGEAISKNGKVIPIEINSRISTDELEQSIHCIIINNSDKKEKEKLKIQIEQELIFNSTSDLMMLVKVEQNDLIITSINNAYWESISKIIPDIKKDEFINSSIYNFDKLFFVSENKKQKIVSDLKSVLETQMPLEAFETISFDSTIKYLQIKYTPILDKQKICTHILLTIQDLTAQRNDEERQNYLANIIESSAVSFIVTDTNGIIIDLNPALEQLTGYTKKELLGKTPGILNVEENATEIQSEIFKTVENDAVWSGEILNKKKNGDKFVNYCSIFPLKNQDGETTAYVSFNQDVTKKKDIEQELVNSENYLRETQIIANLGTYKLDIGTGIWTSSELLNNIFGIDKNYQRTIEGWLGIVHPDWQKEMTEYFQQNVIANRNKFDKEYKIMRINDKSERWVHGNGELKFNNNNEPIYMVGTIQDITVRKQAELNLEESESRLSTLMNNIPGMAYQCLNDDNWTMIFVNEECRNLTGYKKEQLLMNKDISYAELIHLDDRELVKTKVGKKLNTNEPFEIEYRIITADGREKWVWEKGIEIKPSFGHNNVLEGVIHDITERKLADKTLKELSLFNSQILNAAMDGYILADTKGKILEVNPSYSSMIGYSINELLNMNISELESSHDKVKIDEKISKMLAEGGLIFKTKHIHKNGSIIDLDVSITIVKKGEEKLIAALVRDITKQIKDEVRLKESEEKYRLLIENQLDLVVEVNAKNEFNFVSPSYCNLFGKTEEELLGKSFIPLVHEEDRLTTEKEMEKLFVEPYTCTVEQRAMTTKGWRWLEWHDKAILDDENNITAVFGVGRDITEKKEAEIKIMESEEQFKQLFNNLSNGVAIYKPIEDGNDFIIEAFNKAGEDISGLSTELLLGERVTKAFPIVTSMGLLKKFQEVHKNGTPKNHSLIFYEDDRIDRWIENYVYKLPSGQIVAIFEDTSVEKKALESLKNNEEDLRAILNTSLDVILLIDKNGKCIEANNIFCNLVKTSRDEIIGKLISDFLEIGNLKIKKKTFRQIFKRKEYQIFTDEAFGRIWDFSLYPILDSNNEVTRLTIFAKDVTEKSIFEKKIKETNERLKNLTRYMNKVREEERKNVAREIHDNLGQKLTALNLDISWIKQSIPEEVIDIKEQFDPILDLINESIITVQKISTELRPGILDDLGLVNAIQWQSNEISRRTNLHFSLDLTSQEIELGDDVKTTLFRVFQEALTNIVRHAKASNVYVNLLIKEKKLIFEVIDDGKGILEKDINDFRSYGILGMKERVESINGEIQFIGLDKGTKLLITIPIKE